MCLQLLMHFKRIDTTAHKGTYSDNAGTCQYISQGRPIPSSPLKRLNISPYILVQGISYMYEI